jgi:hypothetical protein
MNEAQFSFLSQSRDQIRHLLRPFFRSRRHTCFFEALSPDETRHRLETMGLNREWAFSDFDEVIIEESSQTVWAKIIIRNHKAVLPRIVSKYLRHYKWKENLYELNKIFKYSEGLNELETKIVPHLTLNENAIKILNSIKKKKLDRAGRCEKIKYKYFQPTINLVIVSSNTGVLIKRFLEREDIRRILRENKIKVRAVVANRLGLNGQRHIIGLGHEKNIIDVYTKKNYIPKSNIVLVDNRDRHLRESHPHAFLVQIDSGEIKGNEC